MPVGVVALGLLQGCVSGLLALGLVLTYRTHRVLNLAHAAVGGLAAVVVGLLVGAGWSFWLAAPVGVLTGALLGVAVERLVVARLDTAPRVVLLVATVGVAQVLAAAHAALPLALTGHILAPYDVPLPLDADLGPVRFSGGHLLAVAVCPLAIAALALFLRRTRTGLGVRALACDADRARALGVRARVVSPAAWAVAGALAATGGILAVPVLGFSLDGSPSATVLLLALAPAVVAGLRHLTGAFVASLALGVAYQACLWHTDRAAVADLLLVAVVLVALAVRRGALGHASSWPALPAARPRRAALAVLLLPVIPLLLGDAAAQRFGAAAALALAAVSVSLAWTYAGQLALGQWGVAGLGALVTAVAVERAGAAEALVLATAAGALVAAAIGVAARRDSPLGYATASLAVAVAAPLLTVLVRGSAPTVLDAWSPRLVAVLAAAAVAVVVTAAPYLRRAATALVAAAEDPAHAETLGVATGVARTAGLALAGAAAGLAGALYALVQRGPAPDAFAGDRSLAVVGMAVVGGLGSPARAAAGAFAVAGAQALLPGPWQLLGTGAGVLAVVLTRPRGLADAAAALVAVLRAPRGRRGTRPESVYVPLPGADTAAARRRPSVRRAQLAAFLAGGIGWAAALALPVPVEWAVLVALLVLPLAGLAVSGTAARGLVAVAAVCGLPVGLHVAVAGLDWAAAYAVAALLAIRAATRADRVVARPAPGGAALSVRGLAASYGGAPVVADADLDVRAGELLLVIGGNGAGKSTLLAAVAGRLAHDGSVAVAGRDVTDLAPEDRRAHGLAAVDGSVLDELTVAENLRLAAAGSHRSRTAFEAATGALTGVFPELAAASGRAAATLSGGERRLLAVAQLLYDRPHAVLADEVTLGLSPASRARVLGLLRRMADAGAAVVVVDHDVAAVLPLADRVAGVVDGRLVDLGAPSAPDRYGELVAARHLVGAAP